jgi:hypothetical protein
MGKGKMSGLKVGFGRDYTLRDLVEETEKGIDIAVEETSKIIKKKRK